MLKWILALAFVSMATAPQASHVPQELIYQLKTDKSGWGIETLKVSAKTNLQQLKREMLATGKYSFVAYNTRETLPVPEERTTADRTDVSNQWHHFKLNTVDAWNLSNIAAHVTVAVCDSGIQANHEDLEGQVLPGRNLITDMDEDTMTTSHGTFVAGLIAAKADAVGVAGVSPFVKLLPLRISNELGETNMDLILKCIREATDRGAKVINVSFTGVNHPGVQVAGRYANSKGALLVYAAGNQGRYRASKYYPDFKNVLVVGATSADDTRWKWYKDPKNFGGSNYGLFIDLMAPGHELYSTTIYNDDTLLERYRSGSGTSYAAPLVTAVAALIYSVNPNFSARQVERLIINSADSMGSRGYYGAGRVNALKAVSMARKSLNFVERRY